MKTFYEMLSASYQVNIWKFLSHLIYVLNFFTFPPLRTASGSTQPKVSMSLCTQAGRGVTIVSPSSAPLGAIVPGPDFNKPITMCSSALPVSSQPAAVVTAAQTATGQQPKVPLHVSSQMTVNQARNAVRTGKFRGSEIVTEYIYNILKHLL